MSLTSGWMGRGGRSRTSKLSAAPTASTVTAALPRRLGTAATAAAPARLRRPLLSSPTCKSRALPCPSSYTQDPLPWLSVCTTLTNLLPLSPARRTTVRSDENPGNASAAAAEWRPVGSCVQGAGMVCVQGAGMVVDVRENVDRSEGCWRE